MAKRNISDEEIALIKAMLAKGYGNNKIQFYFNRPDRHVNSGRITGIRTGAYGNSANIPAASQRKLKAFLEANEEHDFEVGKLKDPTSQTTLKKMFERVPRAGWELKNGETAEAECKASFSINHPAKWLRAAAALANNKGGYIFFGVSEKPRKIEGKDNTVMSVTGIERDAFPHNDPVKISTVIKSALDPTPQFKTDIVKLGRKYVGVLYIEKCASKPVIASKNYGNEIREGDIFFRYPGQSSRIKHSELRQVLDDRIRASRQQVLPMLERLIKLGPERAMLADLATGELVSDGAHIVIDEELLDKVEFVKSGEFVEKGGDPTLRLIGDVKSSSGVLSTEKSALTKSDIVGDFLDNSVRGNPKEYIRAALESGQIDWFPLHFYAKKSKLSNADVVKLIDATRTSVRRKKKYKDYIQGRRSAYRAAAGTPKKIMARLEDVSVPDLISSEGLSNIGYAVVGLPDNTRVDLEKTARLLKGAIAEAEASSDSGALSILRRGVCRLDELRAR